ncbi:MAG: hypothetical protein WA874_04890 [Chryseosolibacter sp.]
MTLLRRLITNIWVALAIGAIVGLLTFLFVWSFSFLGYGALLFAYIFILLGLILFYKLTSVLSIGWTVLSFFMNFILWTFEQVVFEKRFHDTVLYQEEWVTQSFVLTFGSLLFAFNKVLLDEVFRLVGVKVKDEMRIEAIIRQNRAI